MSPTTITVTDDEVIRSFPTYQGPGTAGFITDYLGTKTRLSTIPPQYAGRSGLVEDTPIHGNFHSGSCEWAGALRAALDATGELVAVELGAGWAPWLVIVARAAQLRGIDRIRLIGVEGSIGHMDFMRSHLADNGFDPDEHTLVHGVVGTYDGVAEFPVIANPADAYGGEATFSPPAQPKGWRGRLKALLPPSVQSRIETFRGRRGASEPPRPGRSQLRERVPCFSLPTILRSCRDVDLLHVDIQGAEYDVLAGARPVLKEKVKRIVIGTHGRAIEQNLFDELASQAWVLEAEVSCEYVQQGRQMKLYGDGCQVWRNADLGTPQRLSA